MFELMRVMFPFLFVWYVGLVHTVLRLLFFFSDHVRIPSYLLDASGGCEWGYVVAVVVSERGLHAWDMTGGRRADGRAARSVVRAIMMGV